MCVSGFEQDETTDNDSNKSTVSSIIGLNVIVY